MKQLFPLVLIASVLLIACEKEKTKVPEKSGNLEGVVLSEFDKPIEEAKVEVESLSGITGYNGAYAFEGLPVKSYSVSVSKEAYIASVQTVRITEDETAQLDFVLKAGEAFLNISDSVINAECRQGAHSIHISSNAGWTVKSGAGWLQYSKDSGAGNDKVRVSYTENTYDSTRSGSIVFKSGAIKKTLHVNQAKPIKLIEKRGLIGNAARSVQDSVVLLFNKPVIIDEINPLPDACVTELNHRAIADSCGVVFNYGCAELGGAYRFSVSVSDSEGDVFSEEIEIPFYKSKLDFAGLVTDHMLVSNDKELLIAAYYPSRILRYHIGHDSVTQTYDLSTIMSPLKLSYNPYNSKVYIMGSDPGATGWHTSVDRPEVYTLNLQTGEIHHAFTVQPDEYDHPQYPANIPYDMGFTKSGLGIVALKSNGSSTLRWKMIDAAQGDSIYRYPYYGGEVNESVDFNNIERNYDNSGLYLSQPHGGINYGIFDEATGHLSLICPATTSQGVFISPHREAEKFYAGQLYSQFVTDPDENNSSVTYLDNRHSASASFSYRENNENIIYFCESSSFYLEPNRFYVIDYNNAGTTLMWCGLIEGLQNFKATVDGRYGIAHKRNSDASGSLFVFDTDSFHRYID